MGLRKKTKNELFELTLGYTHSYLPNVRKSSPETIRSYKLALDQFLDYLKVQNNVRLYDVTFSMINKQSVIKYLDYIESEQHCMATTRNHRLSCIRAFLKYAADNSTDAAYSWNQVKVIPKANVEQKPVEYMTYEAIQAIISQPNTATSKGLRDMFMILFLYQTGARVQELVNVRLCDLNLGSNVATLHGKGSKVRSIPMRELLVEHLKKYLVKFHSGASEYSTEPLFYTIHNHVHTRMTEDNVRKLLREYGKEARKTEPTVPEVVHPHLFRHSIAMHLYQNGTPLELVSQWLGHSNLETTLIYAYADTEMKRKAIEKAIPEDSALKSLLNSERYTLDDDDLVKRLYGLK